MKKDLWHIDLETLKSLYEEEERHLEARLLDGALWNEVAEERQRLGELYTIIYKRSNPGHFGNPAENASR